MVLAELAKLGREDLGVELLIMGDSAGYEELQRVRTDLDLENCVTLAGKRPYEKIPEFIAASDICLLRAYNNKIMRDIVPIKMYEYMAMRKPVIATRLTGVMKEFGADKGVLYVDRPEDALQKALELVAMNASEVQGEKARQFVQNNDWGTVVDAFENVLLECGQANGR